jgi:hypothetical protein
MPHRRPRQPRAPGRLSTINQLLGAATCTVEDAEGQATTILPDPIIMEHLAWLMGIVNHMPPILLLQPSGPRPSTKLSPLNNTGTANTLTHCKLNSNQLRWQR